MSRSESIRYATLKRRRRRTRQNFVIRFVLAILAILTILAILAILVTKAAVRLGSLGWRNRRNKILFNKKRKHMQEKKIQQQVTNYHSVSPLID